MSFKYASKPQTKDVPAGGERERERKELLVDIPIIRARNGTEDLEFSSSEGASLENSTGVVFCCFLPFFLPSFLPSFLPPFCVPPSPSRHVNKLPRLLSVQS